MSVIYLQPAAPVHEARGGYSAGTCHVRCNVFPLVAILAQVISRLELGVL